MQGVFVLGVGHTIGKERHEFCPAWVVRIAPVDGEFSAAVKFPQARGKEERSVELGRRGKRRRAARRGEAKRRGRLNES